MEKLLEKALRDWNDIQEKCKGLLLDSTLKGRGFQIESLIEFNVLLARYGKGIERSNFLLRMAKRQRDELSVGLKMNLAERLRVFSQAVYFAFVRQRKEAKERQYARDAVNDRLEKKGFSGLVRDKSLEIIPSERESVVYSKQLSPHERVDYVVHMSSSPGGMQLMRFDAALVNVADKTRVRSSFDLTEYPGMDADTAAYLLQGKSVKDPGGSGDWIQLDFTDKDSKGNYRTIRVDGFESDYKIRASLEDLPVKLGLSTVRPAEEILGKLEKFGFVKTRLENGAISMDVTVQVSAERGDLIVKNTRGEQINPRTLKPLRRTDRVEKLSKRSKVRVRAGKGAA